MSSNRPITFLVRLDRNEFGAGDRSNRARTSLERSSGSAFDESSVLSSKASVREHVYVPSRYARSDDRDKQSIANWRRIRNGLRLLTRKINRAIRRGRENAVIYRLLARRFAPESNEASALRLLCRGATRRVTRLKDVLAELHQIWRPAPKPWYFYVRLLGALYTPRLLLCCREERKSRNRV
jgi:hypothetical protein